MAIDIPGIRSALLFCVTRVSTLSMVVGGRDCAYAVPVVNEPIKAVRNNREAACYELPVES